MQEVITKVVVGVAIAVALWLFYRRFWGRRSKACGCKSGRVHNDKTRDCVPTPTSNAPSPSSDCNSSSGCTSPSLDGLLSAGSARNRSLCEDCALLDTCNDSLRKK